MSDEAEKTRPARMGESGPTVAQQQIAKDLERRARASFALWCLAIIGAALVAASGFIAYGLATGLAVTGGVCLSFALVVAVARG